MTTLKKGYETKFYTRAFCGIKFSLRAASILSIKLVARWQIYKTTGT